MTTSRCWRPTTVAEARQALGAARGGVIARGGGRSYGDAALNDGGAIVDARALDAIHAFDAATGELECGAGVTFGGLLDRFVPLGFMPPVCPGTGFVTVGGAIANDVHGKNSHRRGTMGDAVIDLELLLPTGEIVRVSRERDPTLFAATLGGIGLTGVVTRARLRLAPVRTNAMRVGERRLRDLDDVLVALDDAMHRHEHVVSWIDTCDPTRFGSGVLEVGDIDEASVAPRPAWPLRVPVDAPSWLLNRTTIAAFNRAYAARVPAGGRVRTVPHDRFLFPLDRVGDWNRLYGARGLVQFQCVVPTPSARQAIVQLLDHARRSPVPAFLSVLKPLGRAGTGLLSFPMPGLTLALDFPGSSGTRAVIDALADIALRNGGRVYLAKDALLTADRFRAMYPACAEFMAVRHRIDPEGRMISDMARRLELTTRAEAA